MGLFRARDLHVEGARVLCHGCRVVYIGGALCGRPLQLDPPVNPQPSTQGCTPSTLNPKHQILIPQPQTLVLQPSTVNPQLQTINPK